MVFNSFTPLPAASVVFTPADPSGTVSTTQVMMGIAATITPVSTGKIRVSITGGLGVLTGATGQKISAYYGTGTAPINGAAQTGTLIGGNATLIYKAASPTSINNIAQFAFEDLITGLALGVPIWVDIALATSNASDQGFIQNVKIVLSESL